MKYLFLAILGTLIVASLVTAWMMPEMRSDVPVLYWVTDTNPARPSQVAAFHRWLVKTGHVKAGDENKPLEQRRPIFELRLDTSNNDPTKRIIQGVSGVGDDIISVGTFGGQNTYFYKIGLLTDVTEDAQRLGFGMDHIWPVSAPDMMMTEPDGRRRQYLFPVNIFHQECVANRAVFEKYGLPVPPPRWTIEEFEAQGKRFVEVANRGKKRQDVFFAQYISIFIMSRSMGLPTYNETLTACVLDDPRYARALGLRIKWVYRDHILPSAADYAAMTSGSSVLQGGYSLFAQGNFGMTWTGRYGLCDLRKYPGLRLSVSEPPNGGFPVVMIGTYATGVYNGSKHKDLAPLFLAYLASEDHNMQVVQGGDGLPPDPKYTQTAEFICPPDHPEEQGLHEAFANAARDIGITPDTSPYIAPATTVRLCDAQEAAAESGLITPEGAGQTVARQINAEIQRTIGENAALRQRYEALLPQQRAIDERVAVWKQIDDLKSKGQAIPEALMAQARKIPLDWLENPFYRRYYQFKGWVE